MGQKETATTNKNRIMIYGPKNDGTYVVGSEPLRARRWQFTHPGAPVDPACNERDWR